MQVNPHHLREPNREGSPWGLLATGRRAALPPHNLVLENGGEKSESPAQAAPSRPELKNLSWYPEAQKPVWGFKVPFKGYPMDL